MENQPNDINIPSDKDTDKKESIHETIETPKTKNNESVYSGFLERIDAATTPAKLEILKGEVGGNETLDQEQKDRIGYIIDEQIKTISQGNHPSSMGMIQQDGTIAILPTKNFKEIAKGMFQRAENRRKEFKIMNYEDEGDGLMDITVSPNLEPDDGGNPFIFEYTDQWLGSPKYKKGQPEAGKQYFFKPNRPTGRIPYQVVLDFLHFAGVYHDLWAELEINPDSMEPYTEEEIERRITLQAKIDARRKNRNVYLSGVDGVDLEPVNKEK